MTTLSRPTWAVVPGFANTWSVARNGTCVSSGFPTEEQAEAYMKACVDLTTTNLPDTTGGARWRHKKRGLTYTEIGRGKVQADDWFSKISWGLEMADSVDMAEVVIYRADEDGSLWARPVNEFEDGRFERIAPQAIDEAEKGGVFAPHKPDVTRDELDDCYGVMPKATPAPSEATSGDIPDAAYINWETGVVRSYRMRNDGVSEKYVREATSGNVADDEESAEDTWRRLALQFDAHRIEALSMLKAASARLWQSGDSAPGVAQEIDEFLKAPPLSGEKVLAERIAALASLDQPKGSADGALREKEIADAIGVAYTLAKAEIWDAGKEHPQMSGPAMSRIIKAALSHSDTSTHSPTKTDGEFERGVRKCIDWLENEAKEVLPVNRLQGFENKASRQYRRAAERIARALLPADNREGE